MSEHILSERSSFCRKHPSGNDWLDRRRTNAMMQMTGCNRNDSSLRRPCRFRITSAWYTVVQSVCVVELAVIPDDPCWILRKINVSHSNEKSQFHWLLMAAKIPFLPPLSTIQCFPFYFVIIVCNPFSVLGHFTSLWHEEKWLDQCKRLVNSL